MNLLEVQDLCKTYPGFRLDRVSFSVAPGSVMGFIGRNGAGKTTTLKSLLHIVHPDAGEIRFFGLKLEEHEREIKQRIGYAGGAVDFYKRKPIRTLADVTRGFFDNWDDAAYRKWLDAFSLDDRKTPAQLSEGMRVKLSLTLALSHHAELLILDEPTSGLDPVSREELLDAFSFLQKQGVAILFSTHITSDLDKTADNILYIAGGKLRAEASLEDFVASYRLTEYTEADPAFDALLIGPRRSKNGKTALVRAADAAKLPWETRTANLEEIMVHMEKEAAEE